MKDAPVLLIHGNPGHAGVFDAFRGRLDAEGIVSHAYTLPGFGGTPPPVDGDYGLTAQAAWLRERLREDGVRRAVVLGHSHGGSIAVVMAATWPQDVAGLCLIGSAGIDHGNYAVMGHPLVRALVPAMAEVVDELELDVVLAKGLARWGMGRKPMPVRPGQLVPLSGEVLKASFAAAAAWDAKLVRRCAAGVRCPTVVLHGTADRTVSVREARRLAESLPGAKLLLLPTVGHRPHLERPDTVAEALSVLCRGPLEA